MRALLSGIGKTKEEETIGIKYARGEFPSSQRRGDGVVSIDAIPLFEEIRMSREAATDASPGRKPWVNVAMMSQP